MRVQGELIKVSILDVQITFLVHTGFENVYISLVANNKLHSPSTNVLFFMVFPPRSAVLLKTQTVSMNLISILSEIPKILHIIQYGITALIFTCFCNLEYASLSLLTCMLVLPYILLKYYYKLEYFSLVQTWTVTQNHCQRKKNKEVFAQCFAYNYKSQPGLPDLRDKLITA